MKNQFEIGNNQRRTTIRRVAVAVSVLLSLAAAWTAFDRLVPCGPISIHGNRSRAGWYLTSGHWKADVRTFVAAVEYALTPETDFGPEILPAFTRPVATVVVAGTDPAAAKADLPPQTPGEAQEARVDF